MALVRYFKKGVVEAGCDEAGRGCLAGPVFAAAVVWPSDLELPLLNDSKKLTPRNRYALREEIQRFALGYAVAYIENEKIDKINIFKASMLAMHKALERLNPPPEHVLVDGKYFYPYTRVPDMSLLPEPPDNDSNYILDREYKENINRPIECMN